MWHRPPEKVATSRGAARDFLCSVFLPLKPFSTQPNIHPLIELATDHLDTDLAGIQAHIVEVAARQKGSLCEAREQANRTKVKAQCPLRNCEPGIQIDTHGYIRTLSTYMYT